MGVVGNRADLFCPVEKRCHGHTPNRFQRGEPLDREATSGKVGPNIARRHEQRRRERVRLVFHFRRRYLMHDNMPKFVREAEPLPISRHVAVEEDARWHVRYLNREAIHLERGEVTMDDDAASSFYPYSRGRSRN